MHLPHIDHLDQQRHQLASMTNGHVMDPVIPRSCDDVNGNPSMSGCDVTMATPYNVTVPRLSPAYEPGYVPMTVSYGDETSCFALTYGWNWLTVEIDLRLKLTYCWNWLTVEIDIRMELAYDWNWLTVDIDLRLKLTYGRNWDTIEIDIRMELAYGWNWHTAGIDIRLKLTQGTDVDSDLSSKWLQLKVTSD